MIHKIVYAPLIEVSDNTYFPFFPVEEKRIINDAKPYLSITPYGEYYVHNLDLTDKTILCPSCGKAMKLLAGDMFICPSCNQKKRGGK